MALDRQNGPRAKYEKSGWGRDELLCIINKKIWNWWGEARKEGMRKREVDEERGPAKWVSSGPSVGETDH